MTDDVLLAELFRPMCQTQEHFVYDHYEKYDSAEKQRLLAEADELLRQSDAIRRQLAAKQAEIDQNWQKFQDEIVRLHVQATREVPDSQICEQASC